MVQVILTDIEGTTSSISFVRDVLFPYAASALPDYLRRHAGEPEVRELIRAAAAEAGQEEGDLDAVIRHLLQWIEEDRKITALKALQGMIWQAGYENGVYRAHVYEDARRKLGEWADQGYRLYVYSSGSVQAQKLFFRYSEYGDLLPLFRGHFDTAMGDKKEVDSYRDIAGAIGVPAAEILFLSDVTEELDAAGRAGMHTCRLQRPGDTSPGADAGIHPVARSFDEVVIPR